MTTEAAGEMSCKELIQVITDYLEGRLPATDRKRFEDHLAICEGCQNYLDQMRQTIRTLGKLSEEHLAPDFRQRLLIAFRGWKQKTG